MIKLPFDDFVDINLNLTDSDIAKLDRLAAQAEKRLEKVKQKTKEAEQTGIFRESTSDQTLPKSFTRRLERELTQRRQKLANEAPLAFEGSGAPIDLRRKTKVEELQEQTNRFEEILNQKFGVDGVAKLTNIIKNPTGFVQGLLTREVPILGAILTASQIVQFIIDELTKKGSLFDKFFNDKIDSRLDAFRQKELTQRIAAGFDQIIITYTDGTTNPADSFNSFREADKNRERIEELFAVRSKGFT